jgi:hypothetical protein
VIDWLEKIPEPAARRRAELFFSQLDSLSKLRQKAKAAMLAEARMHPVFPLLGSRSSETTDHPSDGLTSVRMEFGR